MAYTVAVIDKYNVSNKRCHVLSITADAAEASIDTGLKIVDHFNFAPQSLTAANIQMFKNVGSTSTAANGFIGVSGITSGDVWFMYVYGR